MMLLTPGTEIAAGTWAGGATWRTYFAAELPRHNLIRSVSATDVKIIRAALIDTGYPVELVDGALGPLP